MVTSLSIAGKPKIVAVQRRPMTRLTISLCATKSGCFPRKSRCDLYSVTRRYAKVGIIQMFFRFVRLMKLHPNLKKGRRSAVVCDCQCEQTANVVLILSSTG